MDRRGFIKTSGTLLAGATFVPGAFAAERDATAAAETSGRMVLPMNRGWLYSRTAEEGATARDFNDAQYDRVVVPHTNIKLLWHGFTEHDYTFVSTYRRHFKLPQATAGRRVFVDFEGVMTASTVWLNGQRLGEYKGGYTPFSFDLTPHVNFDGENVLAVAVDSTERPDIAPFGYEIDYLTFGGIYREVSLRIVPSSFIENIFVRPKNVLTTPGLDVDCFVQHLQTSGPLMLEAELLDGDRVVAKASQAVPKSAPSAEPV